MLDWLVLERKKKTVSERTVRRMAAERFSNRIEQLEL
jgi:hypothetical protein